MSRMAMVIASGIQFPITCAMRKSRSGGWAPSGTGCLAGSDGIGRSRPWREYTEAGWDTRRAPAGPGGGTSSTLRAMHLWFVCLLTYLTVLSCSPAVETKPNFVLILVDDLGYADIGAYGSGLNRTPHLDRMASEGLRFTDFHSNGPMCTPTPCSAADRALPAALRRTVRECAVRHRRLRPWASPRGGYGRGNALSRGLCHRHVREMAPGLPSAFHAPGPGIRRLPGPGSGDGDHHSHIDRSGRQDWWHGSRISDGGRLRRRPDHSAQRRLH